MYDLVTNSFFGNAGSGLFEAGPNISSQNLISYLEDIDLYKWYENDIPKQTLMSLYLDNISKIRSALTLPEEIDYVPPDMQKLTQEEANSIETILLVINSYLMAMQQITLQSGMAWAVSGSPGWYFGI